MRCLHVWLQSPLRLLLKVDHRVVRLNEVTKILPAQSLVVPMLVCD